MTPPRSAKDVLFSPEWLRCLGGGFGALAAASAPRRRPWGARRWLRRVGGVRGATAVLAKLQTALTLLVKALLTGRPTDDERLITKRVKQSRHVSKTVLCCAYFCARFVAPAFCAVTEPANPLKIAPLQSLQERGLRA